jgi:hypothetical protein
MRAFNDGIAPSKKSQTVSPRDVSLTGFSVAHLSTEPAASTAAATTTTAAVATSGACNRFPHQIIQLSRE